MDELDEIYEKLAASAKSHIPSMNSLEVFRVCNGL